MKTETAEITEVKRDRVVKTGEGFIDVEVTFTLGSDTEVRKFGYPLETTAKEIQKDIKNALATRKAEREQAEAAEVEAEETAEVTKAETKADKTVDALAGIKVK